MLGDARRCSLGRHAMPIEGIRAEELPRWVPGDITLASDTLDWTSVKLRAYRYTPLDVEVPALQDFMLVAYRRGPTAMDRRFDGRWRHEDLTPGDVSLLTRAKPSHWHWTSGIEVIHVYLTARMMQQVCEEAFERQMVDVQLRDVLRTRDPVLFNGALAIANEAACRQLGGTLYVDAVARQLCLHALRHYATVGFREAPAGGGLSAGQAGRITEYVDANLAAPLTVERLARAAGVSGHYLLRHFKTRFGLAPHAYVLERRLARARALLEGGTLLVREIAELTGFADQPHLTRSFKRRYGAPPAAFRRRDGGRD
jgi:AraC family transcriptional regulator